MNFSLVVYPLRFLILYTFFEISETFNLILDLRNPETKCPAQVWNLFKIKKGKVFLSAAISKTLQIYQGKIHREVIFL